MQMQTKTYKVVNDCVIPIGETTIYDNHTLVREISRIGSDIKNEHFDSVVVCGMIFPKKIVLTCHDREEAILEAEMDTFDYVVDVLDRANEYLLEIGQLEIVT
jgi:hypothetical protein